MLRAIVITTAVVAVTGFVAFTNTLKPEETYATAQPQEPSSPAPQQNSAAPFDALAHIESRLANSEPDAIQQCRSEWTVRGELNQRMYNHCMDVQSEAIQNLKHTMTTQSDHRFYTISLAHCYKEWKERDLINPRMVNHCMDQEIEAWKDIEYYRDIYGYDRVEDLAHQGMLKYGSWRMGAYHMKRQLGIE